MKIFAAACFTLAIATTAQAETAQDRCEYLAEYAQAVAVDRDAGIRLKEVKELTQERASRSMVDAYNMVASMVYRNSDLSPQEMHDGILQGCLEGIR